MSEYDPSGEIRKAEGRLTHVDETGRASMIDVGDKVPVRRVAIAAGRIRLAPSTVALIRENKVKKGDVLTVAQIAGIQAAKHTHHLIPLCHPLPLTKVDVRTKLTDDGVMVEGEARCTGKTGVEMEALTAVHVALLTVYDMCKAVDKGMVMEGIHLVEKRKEVIE
ncbi:cyclic pyranopterin monophosphate synthase MoaC [Sediminispirochaeta bajacaliforniensis]|uniref:cyclic pyranopterin monophosphate synthase MoaC n=1 Tax=Sediminispirochaeta bajacaliforniensis TaxID=148 RepID=UPI00037BD422|nr:cyclic pyranopterin monophosphate synthase MoaC [Sediminispirochaeta bajacaliforniensis]